MRFHVTQGPVWCTHLQASCDAKVFSSPSRSTDWSCDDLRETVTSTAVNFRQAHPDVKEWNYTIVGQKKSTLQLLRTSVDGGKLDDLIIDFEETPAGCVATAQSKVADVCRLVASAFSHQHSRDSETDVCLHGVPDVCCLVTNVCAPTYKEQFDRDWCVLP